jgi:hypothetical protein
MFRIVCVVVSMFAKSDFGGTNLVLVLSELSVTAHTVRKRAT